MLADLYSPDGHVLSFCKVRNQRHISGALGKPIFFLQDDANVILQL